MSDTLILVGMFVLYSLAREWLFHKTLNEMERERQQPLKDLSQKMMAKDLTELKFRSEPNQVDEKTDENIFDLSEDIQIPAMSKDFGISLENDEGEEIAEERFK